jgi:hypothetical protein
VCRVRGKAPAECGERIVQETEEAECGYFYGDGENELMNVMDVMQGGVHSLISTPLSSNDSAMLTFMSNEPVAKGRPNFLSRKWAANAEDMQRGFGDLRIRYVIRGFDPAMPRLLEERLEIDIEGASKDLVITRSGGYNNVRTVTFNNNSKHIFHFLVSERLIKGSLRLERNPGGKSGFVEDAFKEDASFQLLKMRV